MIVKIKKYRKCPAMSHTHTHSVLNTNHLKSKTVLRGKRNRDIRKVNFSEAWQASTQA